MKLSLSTVLAFYPNNEYEVQNADLSAVFEGITLFDRDFSYMPDRNYLQLIPSQMLLKNLPAILRSPLQAHCTLLCACPDRSILPQGLPKELSIIFLYTQDSFRIVFNRLLRIFQLFEEWDKTLHIMTLNHSSVQELLESSRKFLRYPLLILDSEFSVIAHYETPDSDIRPIEPILKLGYMTTDQMAALRSIGLFPGYEHPDFPIISHYRMKDGQSYHSILYRHENNSRTLAYSLIFHCKEDPRDEYIHQTNILSENLSLYFRQETNFQQLSQENYEPFLRKILDHPEIIKRKQLEDQIRKIPDLSLDGQFLLARAERNGTNNSGSSFACWNLKNSGLGLKPFIYRNHLYILRDISGFGDIRTFLTAEEETVVASCFQQHTYTWAVSNAFFSLTDLPAAVSQCDKTLQLHDTGTRRENTCIRFEDISIQYLVNELENNDALNLITSPGYQKLKQYDTKHHGDLCRIFMQYLQNNRNINQTSATVFLHRNTVLNKIKQAVSIMNDECDSYPAIIAFIIAYLRDNRG